MSGSGPGGRVLSSDLSRAVSAAPAVVAPSQATASAPSAIAGEYTDIQLTNMRK